MVTLDGLDRFCRPNPDCPDVGRRGHGNLTVCGRYGRHQRRLLYRKGCEARLSERKGTPLFDPRLPPGKALGPLKRLADGRGARRTGRPAGVNTNAAARYGSLAGGHARKPRDESVARPPRAAEAQLDATWAFAGRKERRRDPAGEADWFRGDRWGSVAPDPDGRLVPEAVVGERTAGNAAPLPGGVRRRLGGRAPELATGDEVPACPEALPAAFGETAVPPRAGRPGRPAGGDGGVAGGVRGGWGREHLVPGAADRHRPARQRPQGAGDLPVLEGPGGP